LSEEEKAESWIHVNFVPLDLEGREIGHKIGLETHQISEQMTVLAISALISTLSVHAISHVREACEYALNHLQEVEKPN